MRRAKKGPPVAGSGAMGTTSTNHNNPNYGVSCGQAQRLPPTMRRPSQVIPERWQRNPEDETPPGPSVEGIGTRFPRCELHNVKIVNSFPDQCPLRVTNPFRAIMEIRDAGWRQLGANSSAEYGRGLANLERERICQSCVSRLSPHVLVQELRSALSADEQSAVKHQVATSRAERPRYADRTYKPTIKGRIVA